MFAKSVQLSQQIKSNRQQNQATEPNETGK